MPCQVLPRHRAMEVPLSLPGSRGSGRGAVGDGAGVGGLGLQEALESRFRGVSGGRGSVAQEHWSVPSPRHMLEKVKKTMHVGLSSCRLMWEGCDMGTDGSTVPGDTTSHPLPRQPTRGMPGDYGAGGTPWVRIPESPPPCGCTDALHSRLPDRFSQPGLCHPTPRIMMPPPRRAAARNHTSVPSVPPLRAPKVGQCQNLQGGQGVQADEIPHVTPQAPDRVCRATMSP